MLELSMDPGLFAVLSIIAFLAGFVDAVAGGVCHSNWCNHWHIQRRPGVYRVAQPTATPGGFRQWRLYATA